MKVKKVLTVILIVILIVTAFSVGRFSGMMSYKLNRIYMVVEENFALDYDKEYIEDMAAKFMIMALDDPYSEYMTKEECEVFMDLLTGYYKGIGITLLYDEGKDCISITAIEKGGPAEIAGLQVGDVVLYIDDIEATYDSYDHMVYYVRGVSDDAPDDDTEMNLKILRDGEELNFKLKRAELEFEEVTAEKFDEILYIKLDAFSENSAKVLTEELKNHSDFEALVLDLRDNGGGELDALIDIAEQIMPKGLLLTTENAKGRRLEYKIEDDEYYSVPLAVLVNENTASASEVLAAAVKETGRGKLVGVTSFGKGLVQSIIPVGDGSALRLTIEKYYTAGGNYINEVGVEPDIYEENEDKQLELAFEYVKSELEK